MAPPERLGQLVLDPREYLLPPVVGETTVCGTRRELSFQNALEASMQLYGERFGRAALVTDRDSWSTAYALADS